MELSISKEEIRKSSFKWNATHLKGEVTDELRTRWTSLLEDASFFFKLSHTSRLYRKFSKKHAKAFRIEELDRRANLEVAIPLCMMISITVRRNGRLADLNVHWIKLLPRRLEKQQFTLESNGNK